MTCVVCGCQADMSTLSNEEFDQWDWLFEVLGYNHTRMRHKCPDCRGIQQQEAA